MATTKTGTADIDLTSAPRYYHVTALIVTAGVDAAVVHLRDGGNAGTIVATVKAAAESTAGFSLAPEAAIYVNTGVYVDVASGTTPRVTVVAR